MKVKCEMCQSEVEASLEEVMTFERKPSGTPLKPSEEWVYQCPCGYIGSIPKESKGE